MEVRYLQYVGTKIDGTITVRQESALSPFRELIIYPNRRWEIGREMPEVTARRITANLGTLFKVVTETVDDRELVSRTLIDLLEKYKDAFGEAAPNVVTYTMVEAICSTYGPDSIKPILHALKDAAEGDDQMVEKVVETFHEVLAADDPPPTLSIAAEVDVEVGDEVGGELEKKADDKKKADIEKTDDDSSGEKEGFTGTDQGPAKKADTKTPKSSKKDPKKSGSKKKKK